MDGAFHGAKDPSNLNPLPEYVGDFFDFVIMSS